MATTVKEIYEFLDESYPFETQMSFDNAGFLVGDATETVENILVALDISTAVIEEAISKNCQLIVTHHPVIFTPLKSLIAQNPTEKMIIQLITHKISVISAHTNLDRSAQGVNHHLANAIGLEDVSFVLEEGCDRFGRLYGTGCKGMTPKSTTKEFAQLVKTRLNSKALRFTDAGKPVSFVAVGGGSCSSILQDVQRAGCDTFITGDVKYDVFLDAKERGINLIDAGHYPTEQVVCPPMAQKIGGKFPNIPVFLSEDHQEVCQSLEEA